MALAYREGPAAGVVAMRHLLERCPEGRAASKGIEQAEPASGLVSWMVEAVRFSFRRVRRKDACLLRFL